MSETTAEEAEAPAKKKSILPLVIGLVLALAGGGGGFYAVQAGLIDLGGGSGSATANSAGTTSPFDNFAYVEIPPMLVGIDEDTNPRHLRFRASLEVPREYQDEVAALVPRFQDVFNSYMRAIEPEDLTARSALIKIRAQLLRRIKLIAGEGRVRDLLVLEFVLT